MKCSNCGCSDTKVVDSRESEDGLTIRRRRACVNCEKRFSTVERREILGIEVVKRDGRREPYDRKKLRRGIDRACEKRSKTDEDLQNFVCSVEQEIAEVSEKEIRAEKIGEVVLARLKSFDEVAYIRFASVYKSFENIKEFKNELENIEK